MERNPTAIGIPIATYAIAPALVLANKRFSPP